MRLQACAIVLFLAASLYVTFKKQLASAPPPHSSQRCFDVRASCTLHHAPRASVISPATHLRLGSSVSSLCATRAPRTARFLEMTWRRIPALRLLASLRCAAHAAPQSGNEVHCLPLFVIAGAWKCGTTSLWTAMSSHPGALHPRQKELRVFGTATSSKVRLSVPLRRRSVSLPASSSLNLPPRSPRTGDALAIRIAVPGGDAPNAFHL